MLLYSADESSDFHTWRVTVRRAIRSLLVFCTMAASTMATVGTSEAAPSPGPGIATVENASSPTVCIKAHVADLGWGDWFCGIDTYTGTVGQNKAIEALRIKVIGAPNGGQYCGQAHIRNIGWQKKMCREAGQDIEIGTTGRALPMEAVRLWFEWDETYAFHGWSHVQNIGWKYHAPNTSAMAGMVTLGTEGKALNLEAVSLGIVFQS
ncbi:hypothetical protein [Streptomyces sp. MJM1172]|uniref:hypothetical protein n=1 Tax=Streptomyces sp. MJM1172 TaxID=1703926 RepID=UPI00093DAD1C|nr:hypothetical protein [Streptomyces sp. MJM1172]